jgi:hypothetical protein
LTTIIQLVSFCYLLQFVSNIFGPLDIFLAATYPAEEPLTTFAFIAFPKYSCHDLRLPRMIGSTSYWTDGRYKKLFFRKPTAAAAAISSF